MLVLISEIPDYCPKCGSRIDIVDRKGFYDGECYICTCGCGLERASVDTILEISEEEGGDLQYMDLSLDVQCNSSELDTMI